ncbi:hypothetical protein L210DRAFT_3570481, partial [Boletus edulis BED1]
ITFEQWINLLDTSLAPSSCGLDAGEYEGIACRAVVAMTEVPVCSNVNVTTFSKRSAESSASETGGTMLDEKWTAVAWNQGHVTRGEMNRRHHHRWFLRIG